jgi:mRNA-degrading endonuclease toxin of MazEF toxin-antitoxin module
MKVQRGDVVIVDHPHGDASGSKVRPALVVQGDADNARMTNTILATIPLHRPRRPHPSKKRPALPCLMLWINDCLKVALDLP